MSATWTSLFENAVIVNVLKLYKDAGPNRRRAILKRS